LKTPTDTTKKKVIKNRFKGKENNNKCYCTQNLLLNYDQKKKKKKKKKKEKRQENSMFEKLSSKDFKSSVWPPEI